MSNVRSQKAPLESFTTTARLALIGSNSIIYNFRATLSVLRALVGHSSDVMSMC